MSWMETKMPTSLFPLLRKLMIGAFFLIALLVLVWKLPTTYQHLMISFFIGMMLGQSWNISGGYGGLFSFGHAAFFGAGAYTSSLLFARIGVNPWAGMFAGALIAVVLAFFIGFIFLRLKGIYFAIATLAFAEVLRIGAVNLKKFTGGEEGIIFKKTPSIYVFGFEFLNFTEKMSFVYVALLIVLVLFLITFLLTNSKWGYYLIANREDEDVAESLGINTLNCKVLSLALSAFFTSIAGSFYSNYMAMVAPEPVFGSEVSLECVLVAIMGGIGTLWGPVVGSLIYIFLTELVTSFFGEFHLLIHGALLIVFIMFLPYGAIGEIRRLFDLIARKTEKNAIV